MKRIVTILLLITASQLHAQNWSQKMAETVMNVWKDSLPIGGTTKWSYDMGVVLKGFEGIWQATADKKYYDAIQAKMDWFVGDDGTIKGYEADEYNIDHVNNGKLLLLLYRVTFKDKYLKAANLLREQLRHHPRTKEGGFWHKKVYPYQMWLDGLYMGAPFYAEYAMLMHEDTAFNDIANQFIWMENHARDAKTGLLYHAWDESKQMKWADPKTGLSKHFWARAMGWYGDALVDVLDYFPLDHPKRQSLIDILNRLVNAIETQQDKTTGLWYDVMNYNGPGKEKNYFEASASSQFVYAIAKGVRKGYLPAEKISIAKKGYDGIIKRFIKVENGQTNLHGTVKVSGLGGNPFRDGSFEYYMSEPVIANDPKGVGAFLLASNEIEMLPTLSSGKGRTVLLDYYFNHELKKDQTGATIQHHYLWEQMDLNGYSLFGFVWNKYGVKTKSLQQAPTTQNLKGADVYIIVDPDTDRETEKPNYLQQKDIEAIYKWVSDGGVLLLFGNDSVNAEFPHFNELAKKFGIRFNQDIQNRVTGSQYEMGALFPSGNSIFKTPKKIYIKEYSSQIVTKPAMPVFTNGKVVTMSVAKVGKGTVFAVGDPWFYNEYTDGRKLPAGFENYKAAEDLVKWAIKQIPAKK